MTAGTAVITVDRDGEAVLVPAACACVCEYVHPDQPGVCGLEADRGHHRCGPCEATDLDEELDWIDYEGIAEVAA